MLVLCKLLIYAKKIITIYEASLLFKIVLNDRKQVVN